MSFLRLGFLVNEKCCNSRKALLVSKARYFGRKTSANTMALRRCPPNWRANGSDNEWKPLIGPRFIIPCIEYVCTCACVRTSERSGKCTKEREIPLSHSPSAGGDTLAPTSTLHSTLTKLWFKVSHCRRADCSHPNSPHSGPDINYNMRAITLMRIVVHVELRRGARKGGGDERGGRARG